ncbi:hypothetical protein [Neopusillimonas maritima]|uniref:Uncharacterized protein n=1 Tax=Neopusillimonas maritima TaxID=2026239 RepID=A0A3A1YUS7_9BURK|nr:hypothetical protein [Neopusillimonas maritima]RIY41962.1 hypothetical protein CJP73_00505 [Neopusillimonas maritima]
MPGNFVEESQWRKLMTAEVDAASIRKRSAQIVSTLAKVCSPERMPNGVGLAFEPQETDLSLGKITTPFCEGRFRLDWSVEERLLGRLVVERKYTNHQDQIVWQPVMEIMVPEYDNPYVGDGSSRVSLLLDRELGSHRENSVFSLGMSILCAMVSGPRF